MTTPTTKMQVVRMQTLWGLFCRRSGTTNDRETRLAWVSGKIARAITSFNELTKEEAARAIGALQDELPGELIMRRHRIGRRLAHELGTAGRRGHHSKFIALPDSKGWARLYRAMAVLGWERARLDAFLHSPSSPTHGNAIRTLADLNKTFWALKGMAKRRAKSQDAAPGETGGASAQASTPPVCCAS